MGRGSGTQEKILAYIKTEIRAHGYPPSVREIANAVGLKSTATVHDHLQRLERQGYIRRNPLKPRALEIVTDTVDMKNPESVKVPLIGRITANEDPLSERNIEDRISLPNAMLGTGRHFIIRIRDNSMCGAGIMAGDYAVVCIQNERKSGALVLTLINGVPCIRRVYAQPDGTWLLRADEVNARSVTLKEPFIAGTVTSVFRLAQ